MKIKISADRIQIAVWILFSLLILTMPLPVVKTQPVERHFRVEASQFAYTPGVLRVNPGDKVTIELLSTDVVHGIYIDEYELQTAADPGQTARVSFTAEKAGVFRFRCIVPCGQLHPFMMGKLQVGPNLLFLRAVLLSLAGLVGLEIWNKPRTSVTI